MAKAIENDVMKLACALNLSRRPVGVKFLFTEEEYDSVEVESAKAPMAYCTMVKLASGGISLKASAKDFKCPGGLKALGMAPMDNDALSGKRYLELGLYQDLATARKFQSDITFLSCSLKGVLLKPLDQFVELPDVVILVTDAYNTMRILQGYSYKYGLNNQFKLAGSQAICSEVTAQPYEKNSINLSTMCSGTRFWCGWKRDDMAVGMAGNLFHDIVSGIMATLNSTEPVQEKAWIDKRCKEKGLDANIEFHKSYYYTYDEVQINKARQYICQFE